MSMEIAAAGLAGLAGLGVMYKTLRPKFPIKVNCHFCSTDSKVPYHSKNSWFCPTCDQYNGFTRDGDYNRPLGEDSVHRDRFIESQAALASPNNGLCSACNLNQQLKVSQMASYQGEQGQDWDDGVDDYALHLERVYRLCRKCEDVVFTKLKQQDSKLTPGLIAHRLETSRLNSSFRNSLPQHGWLIRKLPSIQFLLSLLAFLLLLDMKQLPPELTEWVPPSLLTLPLHYILAVLSLHLLTAFIRILRLDRSYTSLCLLPLVSLQVAAAVLEAGHAVQLGLALSAMLLAVLATTNKIEAGGARVEARGHNLVDRFSAELSNAARGHDELEETLTQNLLSDSDNSRNTANSIITANSINIANSLHNGEESNSQLVLPHKESGMFSDAPWPSASLSPPNYFLPSPVSSQHNGSNYLLSSPPPPAGGQHNHLLPSPQHSCFLKRDSANSSFSHEFATGDNRHNKKKDLDISSLSLGEAGCQWSDQNDSSPFSRRLYSPTNTSGIHFKPRRPVLSPPKLSARSWVAGGYWGGQQSTVLSGETTTLSRSSSQSSGFVSLSGQEGNFGNFVPASVNNMSKQNSPVNSFCGDWEKFSVLSEPIFRAKPTGLSSRMAGGSVMGGTPRASSVLGGISRNASSSVVNKFGNVASVSGENMVSYRSKKNDKKMKKILQEEESTNTSVDEEVLSYHPSPAKHAPCHSSATPPNSPNSPWSLTITFTAMNLALAASVAVNLGVAFYFGRRYVDF